MPTRVHVVRCADLLQRPLDVDALSPGGRRVGETLAGVAPPGDVDPLSPQVLKGRGHDLHPIICQRAGVLLEKEKQRERGREREWESSNKGRQE